MAEIKFATKVGGRETRGTKPSGFSLTDALGNKLKAAFGAAKKATSSFGKIIKRK